MSEQDMGQGGSNETPTVEPAPAPTPEPKKVPEGFDAADIEKTKGLACLSYIFILFLVPLLSEKESKFAQFHAKQGMTLFLVWIVTSIVLSVIPVLGWMLLPFANLVFVVVSVIGIVKTLSGDAWKIPVISDLQKKLNF